MSLIELTEMLEEMDVVPHLASRQDVAEAFKAALQASDALYPLSFTPESGPSLYDQQSFYIKLPPEVPYRCCLFKVLLLVAATLHRYPAHRWVSFHTVRSALMS